MAAGPGARDLKPAFACVCLAGDVGWETGGGGGQGCTTNPLRPYSRGKGGCWGAWEGHGIGPDPLAPGTSFDLGGSDIEKPIKKIKPAGRYARHAALIFPKPKLSRPGATANVRWLEGHPRGKLG